VAESLLLGAAGCAVGLAAASPLVDVLVSLLPPDVPRVTSIRLDLAVLATAAGVSVAAALLVGLLAAWQGLRAPSMLLHEGPTRGAARARGRVLIVAEVAIGLMVAVLAGLTIRSFIGLQSVGVGFETDGVVAARVALGTDYATPATQQAFFDELLERIRLQQAVIEAGIVSGRPFGGSGPVTRLWDPTLTATPPDVVADARWADAEFFRTLRIPVLAGTLFDESDRLDGPVRVVINESMARAIWPGADPIGRTANISLSGGLTATVIGIVGDIDLTDVRTPVRPGFFLAPGRFGGSTYDVLVRSNAPPAVVIAGLRAALRSLDSTLALHRIETVDRAMSAALARDRFIATLLSTFAALALLLASVGIYGVFADDVASRRKEIGIRIALGAPSRGVLLGMLGRALASALVGIAIGGVGAMLLARSMQSLFFGIEWTDAWSFGAAAVSLLAVTLVATFIPAAHAARVSPLLVLRGE
jgi:predicted permease